MPATLVNSAAGTAAKSFSFAQRQLRFFKIAIQNSSNSARDLSAEFGVDGGTDNQLGLVQQVVQVLQNYGTVEHMRVGDSAASDGLIFAALDVGGSEEVDGATWVPRLAGGSATTLPAAIEADVRVLRQNGATPGTSALGSAGTAGVGGLDVTGSDVTETGLVLT
jgi:hypothetical protein